ncbi:MAG: addiction module toxin RelE [Gammaproteobacteria bacterium]|jgi:hypothetical protein|nr:addiction module toxin RelE [Gammaproteobacteria bacterium]
MWEVEYTDEFENWWNELSKEEQMNIAVHVGLLEKHGPSLRYPYTSGIGGSKYTHMRELRIQHAGKPYRILYAFDPRRIAILLVGGNKTGDDRWYEKFVPIADVLYEQHIAALRNEELIND